MKNIFLCTLLIFIVSSVTADTKRVLFIGNSYIHTNQLPNLISNMASDLGDTLIYEQSTPGGYTMEAHSTNANTLQKIMQGNWDYVVLQEQSQRPAFPDGQFYAETFPYARFLDSMIHAYTPCAQTVFFQTWGRENGDQANCQFFAPLCTYEGMDSMLTLRYRLMADSLSAIVAPVGQVWREVRNLYYPSIQPYSADGSHPSLTGSYLAASTFYTTIFEKNPSGTTYTAGLSLTVANNILASCKSVTYDTLSGHNYVDMTLPSVDTVEFSQLSTDSVYVYSNVQNADEVIWVLGMDTFYGSEVMMFYDSLVSNNWEVIIIATNCFGEKFYTSPPLAVSDMAYTNQAQVYPSPTRDYLFLDKIDEKNSGLIVDVFGREVLYFKHLEEKLDVSNLIPGTYFLLLEHKEGKFLRIPFMKQ